ncbi:sensor histidine kinase [Lactovum odontotermitis]
MTVSILILLIVLLALLAVVFIFLYFNLNKTIKKLYQDILQKKKNDSNLLLTLSEKNRTLADVTREINDLFADLRRLEVSEQQEKDSFRLALHNITHDIRTPLTIASGYTQALLKNGQSDQDSLHKIKQNLDTVAKRLEVLLDYQNLLEVKIEPKFALLNLTESVKEQLLKFYERFESAGFEVDLQLAENVIIEADEELLARVLQNLFGNVLKHGKKHLKVQLTTENGQIRLIVENESQQAIKNLSKLTSRFYSENLSEIEASSGLGLYIVQELAALLNGRLELNYEQPVFTAAVIWTV